MGIDLQIGLGFLSQQRDLLIRIGNNIGGEPVDAAPVPPGSRADAATPATSPAAPPGEAGEAALPDAEAARPERPAALSLLGLRGPASATITRGELLRDLARMTSQPRAGGERATGGEADGSAAVDRPPAGGAEAARTQIAARQPSGAPAPFAGPTGTGPTGASLDGYGAALDRLMGRAARDAGGVSGTRDASGRGASGAAAQEPAVPTTDSLPANGDAAFRAAATGLAGERAVPLSAAAEVPDLAADLGGRAAASPADDASFSVADSGGRELAERLGDAGHAAGPVFRASLATERGEAFAAADASSDRSAAGGGRDTLLGSSAVDGLKAIGGEAMLNDALAAAGFAALGGDVSPLPERAGVIASFILNAAMIPGWPPPRPIEGVLLRSFAAELTSSRTLSQTDLEMLLYLANMGVSRKHLKRLMRSIEASRKRSKILLALCVVLTNLKAAAQALREELAALASEIEGEEEMARSAFGRTRLSLG